MARKYDNAPKKHQTKRKLTSNQQEWEHQIKNLKRRIRDLEGLGADVKYDIPERPDRVTKKAIERIKQVGRKVLEKFAFVPGIGTKWTPPERGKAEERRREVRAQKELEKKVEKLKQEAEEDAYNYSDDNYDESWWEEPDYFNESNNVPIDNVAMQNLNNIIDSLDDAIAGRLNNLLAEAIAQYGEENVANMVSLSEGKLFNFAQLANQYKGQPKEDLFVREFAQVILGRTLTKGELAQFEKGYDISGDFELPL